MRTTRPGIKLGSWILRALVVLVALAVLSLAVWVLVAGPVTVLRILRYGDTNIDDTSHYPGRELQPAGFAFQFQKPEAQMVVSEEALHAAGFDADLETLLVENDTIAFVVVQGDTLLYERYYQGHSAASISQLFSVTKSITSLLIGMAVEDGYIESVNQSITVFIPELSDEGFDDVTFHHLLTMTSGSDYQENDNPFGEHVILNYTPSLEKRILDFEMEGAPGTVFRYKSGDNALLGLALSRALAPETITQYAQRRLWDPLGMQDRGIWTIDHAGDGLEKTWCCLAASARDLAKIGLLYMKEGAWEGRRFVTASWVEKSVSAQVPSTLWPQEYTSAGWDGYGYQWWLASAQDGDSFALGKDGQFLYVNPGAGTVIVRLGWSQGGLASSEWISLFQSISGGLE